MDEALDGYERQLQAGLLTGVEIFPKRVQADATRAHTSWETFITHIEYASIGLGN